MTDTKLSTTDLQKHFQVDTGLVARLFSTGEQDYVKAVDGVSLDIKTGESLGIAGESGCGKTTLAKTLLGLHEPTDGTIEFDGREITSGGKYESKEFRQEAQLIFQDPYRSLNPRFRVKDLLKEPLQIHNIGNYEEKEEKVKSMLKSVGLTPIEKYIDEYSSELSGGERQRVNIGRSLMLEPSFVVCDEPVSMLDVSLRAEILHLLEDLQEEFGVTMVYISHDLSLLKHMCDRIAIMYLGKIVEQGPANQIINEPKHPYTQALVSSTPIIDPTIDREKTHIEGEVPDPINLAPGCRFAPRCPDRMEKCTKEEPEMLDVGDEQACRCVLYE